MSVYHAGRRPPKVHGAPMHCIVLVVGWAVAACPAPASVAVAGGRDERAEHPLLPASPGGELQGVLGSAQPVSASTVVRLGRFSLPVPTGTATTVVGAELGGFSIQPAPTREDLPPAAVWAAHILALATDPAPPRGASPEVRRVAPGVLLAFRRGKASGPETRMADGFIDRGPASVWVQRTFGPGQEEDVAARLARLAAGYAPVASPGAARQSDDVFYLAPAAAVARPPLGLEAIRAVLTMPERDPLQGLVVRMRAEADVNWKGGLIARWRGRAAAPAAREPGTRLAFVRVRPRSVAGLAGEEVVVRVTYDGGASVLALEWEYRGENGRPLRPNLRLAATAESAREATALAAWARLLDGVRVAAR